VVRSFIHRIDRNHDDLVEPQELSQLSVKRNLGITDETIQRMFERIIDMRPTGKRHHVGISWLEIFNEMKVTKHWMKTTDLNVMCEDGENFHVATEEAELERWCKQVQADFASDYPDLDQGVGATWSPEEIERFFASVLSVKNPKNGKLLQSEAKVQRLLKSQSDMMSTLTTKPRVFAAATVAGQRQAWGWHSQPNRNLWLRFFRAAGLQALQPLEMESGKADKKADEEGRIKVVVPPNVARGSKKPQAGKEGQVRVREPRPKVAIREGQSSDMQASRQTRSDNDWHPSDQKRIHFESLVNSHIVPQYMPTGLTQELDPSALGTSTDGGQAADAGVGISFAAQQRFLQAQAKQGRDSEQQRGIGKEKQELARQASLLGQAGASVANMGIKFRGPHQHLGFSHHHLTNSVEPSRLAYEKEIAHAWDGAHVDHSRMTPQKEDVKLSKMTPAEREQQFGFYFGKKDNQHFRVAALDGVKEITGTYEPWQQPEFRHDHPHRHGKYGRRVFDPQVRETQVGHTISGIENKPMEEFSRQQELVHEFLDRSLPPNQTKHFEQYLPQSEFPYRKEVDMMGRHLTGMGNYI